MDVSIVIVNYFTSHYLKECLASIKQFSEGFSYEIIIVDNSVEKQEFKKIVEICRDFKNIKVIDSGENLGFGRANNLGVKSSQGEYLFFLNSDTKLLNNAIFELLQVLKDNKNIGACASNLYSKDLKGNASFGLNKTLLINQLALFRPRYIYLNHKNSLKFNNSNNIKFINGYLSGAAFFIKKSLFNEIKGFSDDIFMYGEDVLLSQEVLKRGYKLANVPSSKILHYEGGADTSYYSDFKISNYVNGNYISIIQSFGEKAVKKYLRTGYKAFYIKYLILKHKKQEIDSKNKYKLHLSYKAKYQSIKKSKTY